MAVVSLKSPWFNSDNLAVYWPKDSGTVTRAGQRAYNAGRHETFVKIDLTTIAAFDSSNHTIVAETVTVPAGAFLEDVEVFVLKETAGVNANLDLGFVKASDRSTEVDFNGLLAAADAFNGGTDLGTYTKFNVGTTEAGALIGTRLAYTSLITANAETANFSAGIIEVRIHWFMPNTQDV